MAPRVALVTTVYNREHYLAQTVESVLAQSRRDLELILWDDGSTDGSLLIARDYEARDERIRVIAAEHQGVSSAMREAMAECRGEYVGCVDSDDFLAPTALEETVAALEAHPNVGFVYTDHRIIDAGGNDRGPGARCRIPYSQNGLLVNFMTFHFRLIRRAVCEQVGGVDASLPCAWDYDLCLRLSEVAPVLHLPRPLYHYRVHADSISCERQVLQIETSEEIIRRALARRGMDGEFELTVRLNPQFILKRKQP